MEESVSREGFIRLGAALSVTVSGAAVVAGCGGGGSGGGYGGAAKPEDAGTKTTASGGGEKPAPEKAKAQGGSGGEAQAPPGNAIASASDVAPGSAVKFQGGKAILVHLDSGDFAAYTTVCTHQGCTVAYQNGQLACPCHGSIFDPANGGAIVNPPATRPLPEIPVEVRGGQVYEA